MKLAQQRKVMSNYLLIYEWIFNNDDDEAKDFYKEIKKRKLEAVADEIYDKVNRTFDEEAKKHNIL